MCTASRNASGHPAQRPGHPHGHRRRQSRGAAPKQRHALLVGQGWHLDTGDRRQGGDAIGLRSSGEQDGDRVGHQPAGRERQG